MSNLFANLVGRAAGTGPQLRPLHPMYRGEGEAVVPEIVDGVAAELHRAAPASLPTLAAEPHASRRGFDAEIPSIDATDSSEPENTPGPADRPSIHPTSPLETTARQTHETTVVHDHSTLHIPVPVTTTIERLTPPSAPTATPPAGVPTAPSAPSATPMPPLSAAVRAAITATELTRPAPVPPSPVPETPSWDRTVPTGANVPELPPAISAVSPPAGPAAETREERHVTVSIGRLEVKVAAPKPDAKPTATTHQPASGLADYLRRRGGGDR